jgi:16S rRNA C967 or C1407 C5-methylase (RsmB/RsmF family)
MVRAALQSARRGYQRGYPRELLEMIERARGHKEPADLTAVQVEHILPQTLNEEWREALGSEADRIQAEWLHRPGNLTLSAYNLELWNHSFLKKRERYAQSNIGITRELAANDEWGEAQIRARGISLAEEAAQIWRA